ncbi:MAG TPA: hypothetical protein VIE46_05425 [Gemmatimonadales bacterium]
MAFTVATGGTDAGSERLPYLDGWRGTAIAGLLIGHFVSGFGARPRFGMNFARVAVTHLRFAPSWLLRLYEAAWLRVLGVLSYSLYVWQQPFMVLRETFRGPLCLAGALVAGTLSFYLLENPARRWINARWVPGRAAVLPRPAEQRAA